jgi:proline iminopeptidase
MLKLSHLSLVALVACAPGTRLVPATVDEDLSLPAMEWNGSRFHLEISGSDTGLPIIFLAGGPGNDFSYLTRLHTTCDGVSLGASHSLVLWDQRSSGLSRRHDDSLLNLETFRADLDGLVELVDPGAAGVILIGHSWGGMFATDYTSRHPERVKALALLEPGALTQDLLDANTSSSLDFDLTAEWASDFAWGQDFLTLEDHERLDFYAAVAARDSQPYRVNREEAPNVRLGGAVVRQSFLGNFYPPGYDFTENLGRFTTETLIIAGDTPTSDLGAVFQREQLRVFSAATLEVLPGAGHTDVAWADGCTSAALINDYLRRVGASP